MVMMLMLCERLCKKISILTTERHETGSNMMMALADVAPAMGMIGTLIGLVAMLSNMDDPKAIGPAMAVALLNYFIWCLFSQCYCYSNRRIN